MRKLNKALLLEVAKEFETDVTSKSTVKDIQISILGASDFEVELLKILIERITLEKLAEQERLDKLAKQEQLNKLAEQERLEKTDRKGVRIGETQVGKCFRSSESKL